MDGDVDLAEVGRLLADSTRSAILIELLSGEALTAGDLARRARVSPQAASNHLRRLREGGLVTVATRGRNRLFALSNREIADALEAIGRIAPARPVRSLRSAHRYDAIRDARTCYDHLAGRLGVGLTERMMAKRFLMKGNSGFDLSRAGAGWLAELDVDVEAVRRSRRLFAPACVDLTERRPHVAGALGAAIASAFRRRGYVRVRQGTRALAITSSGRTFFAELGLEI